MSQPPDAFSIPKSTVRRFAMVVGGLLLLVAVVLGTLVLARNQSGTTSLASVINPSEYQAVFLSNGQVYFGKLTAPGGDFYSLRHVYYLASQASPQGSRILRPTLIKLGKEIHGPEDLMVINRRQILFVENLKPGGQITQGILRLGG